MQNHDQENNSETFEFVDATQLNEEEILKPKYTKGNSYKNSKATRSKCDYPNHFRWSASHGTLEGFPTPIKVGLKEVTSYS